MEYKLFDEYITLQALLKELSIIHSGVAIKVFLANNAGCGYHSKQKEN